MLRLSLSGCLAACLFSFGVSRAVATQTDNHGIHVVPVPNAAGVKVDGDLGDWDLSGAIFVTYDIESLSDVYSAKVAGMYDAANFYIAIRWTDATPMGNSHDPRYQGSRGWAGDAVQIRLKTDRISHITAWYYAAKKEPAFQISYGKSLTEPFKGGDKQLYQVDGWKMQEGVEMAFKANADGKGYVQEIKIPWSVITLGDKKFAAGDQFNMGLELLWGESDWPVHRYADNLVEGATSREFFWTAHNNWGPVFLEAKNNLTLPEPAYMAALHQSQQGDNAAGPAEIAYALPKDARVSLAIEDASGKRIRNLVPGLPRKAGKNTEKWDGLDDAGKPVAPGEYAFKALYHDGIRANYALSFANPGNPSWQTDDGRGAFYGDHTEPQAAAAAGDFIALATPMGEAGKHLIATDLEGQRLWGLSNRVAFDGGRISLATDGKILWVASEGKQSMLYRVDIATGRYAPWEIMQKDKDGNEFKPVDLLVSDLPGLGASPTAANKVGLNHSQVFSSVPNLCGISCQKGILAAAFRRENEVRRLDANTGTVLSAIKVEAPQAVAYTPTGEIVILSKGLLLIAGADGRVRPLSAQAYADAWGIAVGADGLIYVSVRGADMNVKVLGADGNPLREIGQRGGRPQHGAFIAGAMRNPAGIAIDSRNRLWVTEETDNPKRTSVWDVKTGKLLKDLSGTTSYAGAGTVNPFDATMGFSDNTVYRLDWKTGASQPVYSIGKSDDPDAIFKPSVHDITSRLVKKKNLLYVYTTGAARGAREVQVTLFDGKNWRSAAHLGVVVQGKDTNGDFAKYQHPFFAGHDKQRYAWADENGDGIVQPAELQFSDIQIDGTPVDLGSYYWGQLPDTDGTVTYTVSKRNELVQFPVTGQTKAGAPIYDLAKFRVIRPDQPVIGKGNGEGQIIGGSQGRIYLNQDPVIMVEQSGHVVGGYPNPHTSVHGSHDAKAARPGYLIGPSSFLGVIQVGDTAKGGAGEVFCLNGNLGENYLFTYDGLFIQSLFKDTRGWFESPAHAIRGMPLDAITAGGESFGGNFVRTTDGRTYLTNGGTDARVIEITGLESIKRFSGKFTYTAAQFAEAQQLLANKTAAALVPKTYVIAVGTATIDGKASEWPGLLDDNKPALDIQENRLQRYARVEARYDANNLYVAYRVFANRSAIKNVGQDERLLFKSGDAVDLMLGPDVDKDAAGQLRLLMTFMGKTPVAVLNQKTVPGADASEKFDFSSPWRTITFARVVTAKAVTVASAPAQGGYIVEASIPWSVLGVQPKSGLKLRGDVGVLFGDGGTQTISRQYWSNKATGLVNDVPGEADLSPRLWGTFTLE